MLEQSKSNVVETFLIVLIDSDLLSDYFIAA
jgi:hypothetical protein